MAVCDEVLFDRRNESGPYKVPSNVKGDSVFCDINLEKQSSFSFLGEV